MAAPEAAQSIGKGYILPDAGTNPIQEALGYMKEAKQAPQKAQSQLASAYGMFGDGWDQDLPYITEGKSGLINKVGGWINQGVKYNQPGSPEYMELMKDYNNLQAGINASKQQKELFTAAVSKLQANPDKYDTEQSLANLQQFKAIGNPYERAKLGNPEGLLAEKGFTPLDHVKKLYSETKPEETFKEHPFKNGIMKVERTELYTPTQLDGMTSQLLGQRGAVEYYKKKLSALPKEQQEKVTEFDLARKDVEQMNAARTTPQYIQQPGYSKSTPSWNDINGSGAGGLEGRQDLYQLMTGVMSGNPSVFNMKVKAKDIAPFDGKPHTNPEKEYNATPDYDIKLSPTKVLKRFITTSSGKQFMEVWETVDGFGGQKEVKKVLQEVKEPYKQVVRPNLDTDHRGTSYDQATTYKFQKEGRFRPDGTEHWEDLTTKTQTKTTTQKVQGKHKAKLADGTIILSDDGVNWFDSKGNKIE